MAVISIRELSGIVPNEVSETLLSGHKVVSSTNVRTDIIPGTGKEISCP